MNKHYMQKLANVLKIDYISGIPQSLGSFIEFLQLSKNWDQLFKRSLNLPAELDSSLQHLSLFSIETVMDLGNAQQPENRNKNSHLLFILNNRSEANMMHLKAFEFSRLTQIKDDVRLEDLINKVVLVAGRTNVENNTLLLSDSNFQILEVLDEKKEKMIEKKILEIGESDPDFFFDYLFSSSSFQGQRISAFPVDNQLDQSEEDIDEMNFENLKG